MPESPLSVPLSQMTVTPYDELPYRCLPIEWTAPERLALTARLHGGPRTRLEDCRVLELGCGDGGNLLPMAWYRRHARFVGIDAAGTQIGVARCRARRLGLSNVEFIHADVRDADTALVGRFDYIIAHGLCSWIPSEALDALFRLCAERLEDTGLLYLNYNAKPGWGLRGTAREYLLAAAPPGEALGARTRLAQALSASAADALGRSDSPYHQALANEFRLVAEGEPSYVAHEYLAVDNHAFWRAEFMTMAQEHGLRHLADADFNHDTGRTPDGLVVTASDWNVGAAPTSHTVDLMCYRQMHSPLMVHAAVELPPALEDLSNLTIAAALTPVGAPAEARFVHPSGYEVEAKVPAVARALETLRPIWPKGLPVGSLFEDEPAVRDDLRALHRIGLIDLRCHEPPHDGAALSPLTELECQLHGGAWVTNAYHMRVSCASAR